MSPAEFVNLEELEGLAAAVLPRNAYDYIAAGAESGAALQRNTAAFSRYRILPRCLVDVSRVDTRVRMFGYDMAMPVLVAPMAMHGLAHASKELGTAAGAAAACTPMVVSTMATTGLQEVPAGTPNACLLFQLYIIRDRSIVEGWVRQAEAAGYCAIVVTVDAQRLGRREADERNRFQLPSHLQLVNLAPLFAKRSSQAGSAAERDAAAGIMVARGDDNGGSGLYSLFDAEIDDSLTWAALPWLRSITSLPVYVKGVLSPADAVAAVDAGVAGIIVSNHGGRQLDYAPAALDVLPAIVAAVARRVPVLMDGGVRRGTDVLKALALGADAVLVGRPLLYALALDGPRGVERALRLLHKEFELTLALCGCQSVADVGPHLLLATSPPLVPVTAAAAQDAALWRARL